MLILILIQFTEHLIAYKIGNIDNHKNLTSLTLTDKILLEHHISHQFTIEEISFDSEDQITNNNISDCYFTCNLENLSGEYWQPPKI
jgi:hypothetical protein